VYLRVCFGFGVCLYFFMVGWLWFDDFLVIFLRFLDRLCW